MTDPARVLVKEEIAPAGLDLLRERFEVDVGTEWADGELPERIADYDALIVRSATQVSGDLIERADRLKVIGRAGIGVDNIDVEAATKRGVVVANAPQSNVIAAAEHTIALMLALCRNVPQAHASLTAGRWERKRFGGVEVYRKTLGVLGFGRIGQLVAERAKGFGMTVVAFDPFVSAERYRELGVERAESSAELYARAEIVTLHLPRTPETAGWLDEEAFDQMRETVALLETPAEHRTPTATPGD
jgi:D-3-phosphoglycerate dehydrogenase